MGNDLPDYQISVETGTLEASSLVNGADAAKSATPAAGDVYIATDTGFFYICYAVNVWTNILTRVSVAEQSAARALATNYTNSTKIRLVVITLELQVTSSVGAGDSEAIALSDSATPPVTEVGRVKLQAKGALADDIETFDQLVFTVKPGEKYRVNDGSGGQGVTPNIYKWLEYDLL